MIPVMKRKLSVFILAAALVAIASCVKETYEIDKLSKQAHLMPGFGVSVLKGTFTLSDVVEPNDTIVFDSDTIFIKDDNVVSFIYRKDSIINFSLEDYYDINDMISHSDSFKVGELSLDPFQGKVSYTLGQISNYFSPALRATFAALDGATANFPSFPSASLGEITYTAFNNFEYATFSEGSLDISVKNNLPAPLSGLSIRLFNTSDHSQVGDEVTISTINPGQTGTASIDLANLTVTNHLIAAIVLSGSPGTSTPVLIDLDASNIEVTVAGKDMMVKSGRIILPVQDILSLDDEDTVSIDPGNDIEISLIKILTGSLSYNVNAMSPITASLSITLPTSSRNGVPITETITVNPNSSISGNISLTNSSIDLGTVTTKPYNMLPINYSIEASSGGQMVDFNSADQVILDLELSDPGIDYVKGYFGQYGDTIDADTLDLEIKDILENVSGSFLVSSPSVRMNYSNSFAIPVEISLNVVGYSTDDSVDLDLDPVTLSYPAAPSERDKDGIFTVNKDNSQLPEIISMPPEKIRFGGSAVVNPDGNTGTRDNYIFGNSRFLGDLEVEVPLEFRLNNLHFADTVDNPVQDEDFSDSPVNPEDIETLKILMDIENGFPLGISLSVSLYDSTTHTIKSTVNAADILEPATVDASGRVTAPAQCSTEIALTQDFWKWINDTDKIIFSITLVTSDGGTKDVKIYSDYYLDYKAALFIKPDIKFSFE
jgi:hypothetical protein